MERTTVLSSLGIGPNPSKIEGRIFSSLSAEISSILTFLVCYILITACRGTIKSRDHSREPRDSVFRNAVKYVFSANTVLILIQYFLGQISVLNLTEFFIARN